MHTKKIRGRTGSGGAQATGERGGCRAGIFGLGDCPYDDCPPRAAHDYLVQPVERLDAADRVPRSGVLVRGGLRDQLRPGCRSTWLGRRRLGRAAAVVAHTGLNPRRVALLR